MSIEYYSKLERGALAGVSAQVLDAIARALQLDDAERAHLFHLARHGRRHHRDHPPGPAHRETLDTPTQPAMDPRRDHQRPAIVRNGRLDLLATNLLGRAMHHDLYTTPDTPPNFARFTFLDRRARDFYPDWDAAADISVAILRTSAGRDPHDKAIHDLVGELSTRSEEFGRRWGSHDVRTPRHRHEALPPPRRRRPDPGLREPWP